MIGVLGLGIAMGLVLIGVPPCLSLIKSRGWGLDLYPWRLGLGIGILGLLILTPLCLKEGILNLEWFWGMELVWGLGGLVNLGFLRSTPPAPGLELLRATPPNPGPLSPGPRPEASPLAQLGHSLRRALQRTDSRIGPGPI